MPVNDLDNNKLTPTQREWAPRRGDTIRVRTAGGRVMNTDVPRPGQRFKQFCYALDAGLLAHVGEVEKPAPARRRTASKKTADSQENSDGS